MIMANCGLYSAQAATVTQAAFMAATKRQELTYPDHIIPWRPMQRLERFLPSYVALMGLDAGELSDLIEQQDKFRDEHFVPACQWKGVPVPVASGSPAMRVGFSRPIFSSDSKLAVIEVSFRSQGVFGYGVICVMRRADADWVGRCTNSWIARIERDPTAASVSEQAQHSVR
jgi:hypothetical protein